MPGFSVVLVAMPWAKRDRPSAALAALSAWLKRERPEVTVTSRSEFVRVSTRIGEDLYDDLAASRYLGELIYMPLVYPEKTASVRAQVCRWNTRWRETYFGARRQDPTPVLPDDPFGPAFDVALAALARHVESVADELAGRADLIGLSTCTNQVFANVALARAIKRRAPKTSIVLGGSSVSTDLGAALLREFPAIDFVVHGEGERPLTLLVDALQARAASPGPDAAVLSRATLEVNGPRRAGRLEVDSLDALPLPDYDEYAALAEEHAIEWVLPVEFSRGGTSVRGPHRAKSPARTVADMVALADKHRKLTVSFSDTVAPRGGLGELATRITNSGKQFTLAVELHASVRPLELLLLREAGMTRCRVGIEGLSTLFLRRVGKGTTALQNLQAMRLCAELGLDSSSNLVLDFPGATAAEVEETRRTILDHALGFQPLNLSPFTLGMRSTVDELRDRFGVTNVRNLDLRRAGLPDEVWRRLPLVDLAFDHDGPKVDWTPVLRAASQWTRLHADSRKPLLSYADGGGFINVTDLRFGDYRAATFTGLARLVYLECMEIRSLADLVRKLGDKAAILEVVDRFVDRKLMCAEDGRYLSLAVAPTVELAARRIRDQAADPPVCVTARAS